MCRRGITTLNLSCVGPQTVSVFSFPMFPPRCSRRTINVTSTDKNRQIYNDNDPLNTSTTLWLAIFSFLFFNQPFFVHNFFFTFKNRTSYTYQLHDQPDSNLPSLSLHLHVSEPVDTAALFSYIHRTDLFPAYIRLRSSLSHSTSDNLTFAGLVCLLTASLSDNLLWRSSAFQC